MESFQSQFHRRWGHLNDPHVRALAWLLDAPDLLDPDWAQWQGQIATLKDTPDQRDLEWLAMLDGSPEQLHAYLDLQPFSRLGRYAEKLMAFYFRYRGTLIGHGIQVRAENSGTVGEFDFLLQDGAALVHWEFATKFYLHEPTGIGREADYFIGPNLADTLGTKMRKILGRQLLLARHPASKIHLPQPVASAQALIKGWLFYHENDARPDRSLGVSHAHCRGFWCTLSELDSIAGERFALLPRLRWLAPAKLDWEGGMDRQTLRNTLGEHFNADTMPVMVAVVAWDAGYAIETNRGFIVPEDWRFRARQRIRCAGESGS